jgi:hypothetical protein
MWARLLVEQNARRMHVAGVRKRQCELCMIEGHPACGLTRESAVLMRCYES